MTHELEGGYRCANLYAIPSLQCSCSYRAEIVLMLNRGMRRLTVLQEVYGRRQSTDVSLGQY